MTRSSCPTCRLRFSRETTAQLAACPFCAQPLQALAAADTLGFRLLAVEPLVAEEPAVARGLSMLPVDRLVPPLGDVRPLRP